MGTSITSSMNENVTTIKCNFLLTIVSYLFVNNVLASGQLLIDDPFRFRWRYVCLKAAFLKKLLSSYVQNNGIVTYVRW